MVISGDVFDMVVISVSCHHTSTDLGIDRTVMRSGHRSCTGQYHLLSDHLCNGLHVD